jgi:hypothetical protein
MSSFQLNTCGDPEGSLVQHHSDGSLPAATPGSALAQAGATLLCTRPAHARGLGWIVFSGFLAVSACKEKGWRLPAFSWSLSPSVGKGLFRDNFSGTNTYSKSAKSIQCSKDFSSVFRACMLYGKTSEHRRCWAAEGKRVRPQSALDAADRRSERPDCQGRAFRLERYRRCPRSTWQYKNRYHPEDHAIPFDCREGVELTSEQIFQGSTVSRSLLTEVSLGGEIPLNCMF